MIDIFDNKIIRQHCKKDFFTTSSKGSFKSEKID